jgi:hypothetical protein
MTTATTPKAKPGALRLAPLPTSGLEREAALKCLAVDLATQLGPVTARYLAALLDEVSDECARDDTVHVRRHTGEQAP